MSDLYGVFYTDSECGCDVLTAIFSSEELARTHSLELSQEMRPLSVLSTRPKHIVVFHAIYYSWLEPLGSSEEAWSYEKNYEALIDKLRNLPKPEYWENGRGSWTLMAFGKTRKEAESSLDMAMTSRLHKPWTFASAKGKWLS